MIELDGSLGEGGGQILRSTLSLSRQAKPSAIAPAIVCSTSERCEYSTPFGRPVVPDV